MKKEYLESLPIRLFCVHGNHEARPETLLYYKSIDWCGGKVWQEDGYSSLIFAKDGEIYNLLGHQVFVIGGAYSIDKYIRNIYGWKWWRDEQPSEETKRYVERQLKKSRWNVDIVLSHTCPMKYEPRETFLYEIDQKLVDKTTEAWLDTIEERLFYSDWFCGHFHIEKEIERMHFVYENYIEITEKFKLLGGK
jgi:3-oxoacid CoA-transferase subunit A